VGPGLMLYNALYQDLLKVLSIYIEKGVRYRTPSPLMRSVN